MLRRVRTSLVVGAVLIAGAVLPTGEAAAVGTAAAQVQYPLYMQVVAHPDDELFFMDPDVDRSINTDLPAITVYLTAGELTGDGATPAERARNRQRGLQNAYAEMAGVADSNDATQAEWEGVAFQIGGRTVEMYLLRARPDIHLVFLNLPDGQLRNVDTGGSVTSIVPAGGLVSTTGRYNRADILTVLRSLMSLYQPSVLRTLDAEPDRRAGYDEEHPDHVAAARFARDAAAGFSGSLYELNYRGYNISDVPSNLSAEETARKSKILNEYYRYDTEFGNSHGGDQWLSRMYHRWPLGTGWVARNAGNNVQAFVVGNGVPKVYSPLASGIWGPGVALADTRGRLAPSLSVARASDGRLTVVAHRLSDHHILALAQAANGTFATSWSDLGNPNTGTGSEDQVGSPVAAVNADGRVQVFVKNGGGGISSQVQNTSGGWTGRWDDLGGEDLQDGLAVVTGAQGRIELFASSRGEVQHWKQARANAALTRDTAFRSSVPASPPQASADAQGRISLTYRAQDTGRVLLQAQDTAGGAYPTQPTDLGGTGVGDAALVTTPAGEQLVFARNRDNGLSVARKASGAKTFGAWSNLGGTLLGDAGVTLDSTGLATLFTIGPAGVSVRQQTGSGQTPTFASQLLGQ
jgi:LmbE family N-acetylglucosaminyl deacetylase